ncbi:MAG: SMEK domain-containing protein [Chitinophagaceae bacterium]|nr:SMEK domain-containing protein [Chitinophagaceae bacterium]
MENMRALLNRLSKNVGTLTHMVRTENKAGDTSLNVHLEGLVIKIMNIVYGFNFTTANETIFNNAAVDAYDRSNRVIAQITSTFTTTKITDTLSKALKNGYQDSYDRLIIVFLSEKGSLSDPTRTKIKKLTNGEISFDPTNDLIDLNDIYSKLAHEQDAKKILDVLAIMEQYLYYTPVDKAVGFYAVSICFHDEEIENAYLITNFLLQKSINVYTESAKLYDLVKKREHGYSDYLLFYQDPKQSIPINFCLPVLSTGFVIRQIQSGDAWSPLLQTAIEFEDPIYAISFNRYIKDIEKVNRPQFKASQFVTRDTFDDKIQELITSSQVANFQEYVTNEDVIEHIRNKNPNFQLEEQFDEEGYTLLNFCLKEHTTVTLKYLLLNRTANIPVCAAHFHSKFKDQYRKNLSILMHKEAERVRKKTELVQANFQTSSIIFIHDLFSDKIEQTFHPRRLLEPSEYVSPIFRQNTKLQMISDILNWIAYNATSFVGIIHGAGGVGKTTASEIVHDTIVSAFDSSSSGRKYVLFIEAKSYIDAFSTRSNLDLSKYDLYTIFRNCHPQGNELREADFYLNYAIGNLIIIFDGVDEIVSTLPYFNLTDFLVNLEKVRQKLGRGKILINCRDAYISTLKDYYDLEELRKIQFFELLPFNEDLATSFFRMYFADDAKVHDCIRLAKEFHPENGDKKEFKFPPFILQVIVQIVDSDFRYTEIDLEFKSSILLNTDYSDLLIFKVCKREYFKKEQHGFQLNVDDQVKFLCALAIEEKGEGKDDQFLYLLRRVGITDRIAEVADSLRDHPFLSPQLDGQYSFRFEFMNINFKAIAIFNLLISKNQFAITERLLTVIGTECHYNTPLSAALTHKAIHCDIKFEDCLLQSKEFFDSILKFNPQNDYFLSSLKKKCICNLFIVIVNSKPSYITNNEVIDALFTDGNKLVKNFYLYDIPADASFRMEFSNLIFTSSEIDNFAHFFSCPFNKETLFDDTCRISNVTNEKINLKQITATDQNFDKNIQGDNSIFRTLSRKAGSEIDMNLLFKAYFKPFFKNRTFENDFPASYINLPPHVPFKVQSITKCLQDNDIIDSFNNGLIHLNSRYVTKLHKFIDEGLIFKELNKTMQAVRKISEHAVVS